RVRRGAVVLGPYVVLLIGAAIGIWRDRASGGKGVIGGSIAGSIGFFLGACFVAYMDPMLYPIMGAYLFILFTFWGAVAGGILGVGVWLFISLLKGTDQDKVLSGGCLIREGSKPPPNV